MISSFELLSYINYSEALCSVQKVSGYGFMPMFGHRLIHLATKVLFILWEALEKSVRLFKLRWCNEIFLMAPLLLSNKTMPTYYIPGALGGGGVQYPLFVGIDPQLGYTPPTLPPLPLPSIGPLHTRNKRKRVDIRAQLVWFCHYKMQTKNKLS